MAAMQNGLSTFSNILRGTTNVTLSGFQQVRNKYVNRWMKRDVKRRKWAEDCAPLRLRLLAIKRNDVLPIEIREVASKRFDAEIPRGSAMWQLTPRCVVTSRPRGVLYRWRLSRIVFRDLADYNKLSGVIRAIW